MTIREELEARERQFLAPQAARSAETRGRLRPEAEDDMRPGVPARPRPDHPLQGVPAAEAQDPGLLRAGRRPLPHPADAHARGVADRPDDRQGAAPERGPDRGHRASATTSGTRRSATGASACSTTLVPGGFTHTAQSLRVVDVLERDGQGLNLTWEVRDGIARHSKGKSGAPVGGDGPGAHARGPDRSGWPTSSPTSTTTSTTRSAPACWSSRTCRADAVTLLGAVAVRADRPHGQGRRR